MQIGKHSLTYQDQCWVLTIRQEMVWTGKSNPFIEQGTSYVNESKTYHATVPQAIRYLLNNLNEDQETLSAYVDRLETLVQELSKQIMYELSEKQRPTTKVFTDTANPSTDGGLPGRITLQDKV